MKKVFVVVGIMICCAAFVRAEQVVNTNWCKITVPDSAKVGEAVKITIEVGTIPDDMKIKIDLHGASASGAYMGVNQSGKLVSVKSGETLNIEIVPAAKEGLGSVQAVAFVSPKGLWAEQVALVRSAKVPITP